MTNKNFHKTCSLVVGSILAFVGGGLFVNFSGLNPLLSLISVICIVQANIIIHEGINHSE